MDFSRADELKARLAAMRPLNAGELKRLRDDFNIEYTYDTNAIEGSTLTLRETALVLQEDITIQRSRSICTWTQSDTVTLSSMLCQSLTPPTR